MSVTPPAVGLRGRILLALVVTSLATLAVTALVLLPRLEERLVDDRLQELRGLARTSRPALRVVLPRDRDATALRSIVVRLQRRTGGRVSVHAADGRTLVDTGVAAAPVTPAPADLAREARRAERKHDAVAVGEQRGVAYSLTSAGSGGDRLTLVIAKRLDDTQAAVAVIRSAMLTAVFAALAVAVVLGVVLSRGLLRRLDRLRSDARALGTVGLDHPITTRGGDEVADVARVLEEMRGRLVEERTARQEFVSTASHELRTPLASLQANLELLREELADEDGAAVTRTDAALRQTRRLIVLAADLLDLGRVDAQPRLDVEPVEVWEIVTTIAPEFEGRLGGAGRVLELRGGPAIANVAPSAVARVLRILLDNAVNYGAGTVTVTLRRDGEWVRLEVEDDGPGPDPDEHERMFGRFVRGRAASSAHGAGLGLPIARGLAHGMGGEVIFVPDADRTRFALILPAVATDPEPSPERGRR